jgi:hypothetical protein
LTSHIPVLLVEYLSRVGVCPGLFRSGLVVPV